MSDRLIEIVASNSISDVAKKTYDILKEKDESFSFSEIEKTVFANKEIKTKIPNSIRHKDIYYFHNLYSPDPNTSLVEMLLSIDAIKRASANKITLVLPYMSYLRQDRKDEPRVPISARAVANLIESNKSVDRIITMDLHSDQAQGFYDIPVDNLYGSLIQAKHFEEKFKKDYSNVAVVSPDHGGAVRARRFAKYLDESIPVYIIDKRRTGPNQCEVLNFVGGSIKGKDVIIYDDMIDTGGSIIAASKVAKEKGVRNVYTCATHGLFSTKEGSMESSEEKFKKAGVDVYVTNSIPRSEDYYKQNSSWLTKLPIEELLAKAVYESSRAQGSVSKLFER